MIPTQPTKPQRLNQSLYMPQGGGKGYEVIRVMQGLYGYVTIYNNTPNTISVFEGEYHTATPSASNRIGTLPAFQALPFPINHGGAYTFTWLDGGGTEAKEAQVVFSTDNLNISTQLSSASQSNVTIGVDSVGLARQAQLPSALDNDTLKVSLSKVKTVGSVKVTAAGAGTQTVKASAGSVYAIRAQGATVTLRDSTTDKWEVASGQGDVFQHPIPCGTSIVVNFSAAGSCVIQYE